MKWSVGSGDVEIEVEAETAKEAFDALRHQDHLSFGLICVAQPVGGKEEDAIPIRTSKLLGRWGDVTNARLYIARAIELGLGDTSAVDLPRRLN
jgi:hypothetical protein